ncbi:S1/P1 nuclease [Shinella sp.]|uniref:S1/P1 nuclease n=1 Tax=Shinella sp. TaxID=1870904 RepID=UPI0028B070F5|nr:S1/P1 nuclease [Shinella sp.]
MRIILKILTVFLMVACSPLHAFAWGREGHKVVALIAESRLTPAARAEVQRLLASEGSSSLADVALWADEIKSVKALRQPSHGVNLPLDSSPYDPKRDCGHKICVIEAIERLQPTLADKRLPISARMMALKYLVHLVGDIHQPLHATTAGARTVVFDGAIESLHKVWDSGIIRTHKRNPSLMALGVEATHRQPVTYGSPLIWALESRDIARDTILPELPADGILPPDYADRNWDLVEERLHEAGRRLALMLNQSLDPGSAVLR